MNCVNILRLRMKNPFKLKEKKARTLSEALKTAKKIGYPVDLSGI